MDRRNVLTVCISVVLCMSLYVMKVMDANDPAELAALEKIERVKLEQIRVEEKQKSRRVIHAAEQETKREATKLLEMKTLVTKGVSPFAARCVIVGVGNSSQQERCLKAGGKTVKKN